MQEASMPPRLHLRTISLQTIDLEDPTYCFSPGEKIVISDDLVESVARFGLIHPPIVKDNPPQGYQVVSGRKRLIVLKEHFGKRQVECLVLSESTPPKTALALSFENLRFKGPVSLMQQAEYITKMLQVTDEREITDSCYPQIGLSHYKYPVRKLVGLTRLEETVKQAIHAGDITVKTALQLADMSFTDRMSLFEIIQYLKLSVGNQKKLMDTCRELAKRDNTSIMNIVADPEIQEALKHDQANIPQKTAALMQILHHKRLPRYCQARKNFTALAASLELPKEVQLTHAESFEKDTVTLSITFADSEALEGKWPALKKILSNQS